MGEVDLDAAIRAKLDADAAWREASGPGFDAEVDGPEVAAEADAYARALSAVLRIAQDYDFTSCQRPCDEMRQAVARELGVTP